MLIQQGIKHKQFLGIKRKIKAESFHDVFGSTSLTVGDFNLDSGLRAQPNQNIEDPVFNTPAQPNGCGGEGIASVMGDSLKKLCNPFFSYQEMCQAEGQDTNEPVDLTYILNEPVVSGVRTIDGEIIKSPQWYEVKPLNGSLFEGMLSAMVVGGASLVYAGDFYESWESPLEGVVFAPEGNSSGHFWKFCGQKTINGVPYLISSPWLGSNWGENGFCYFPQSIVDSFTGQVFTPKESPDASEPVQVSRYSIIESLLNFLKELFKVEYGSTQTVWQELEGELEHLQEELNTLTHMNPDQVTYPWDSEEHNYHNVRVLCDNAGLTLEEKNILCACLYQESQFSNFAKNYNRNSAGEITSTDWGICQINDYYHIGEGKDFPSVAYVLDNPDKVVEWMIGMYQHGLLKQWVSYSSGAYTRWLEPNSPMWLLSTPTP